MDAAGVGPEDRLDIPGPASQYRAPPAAGTALADQTAPPGLGPEDRPDVPRSSSAAAGRWPLRLRLAALNVLCVLLVGGGGAIAVSGYLAALRAAAPAGPEPVVSREVVDREGRLLRPFALADGRWRLKAETEAVDPRLVAMLLAYEDRRFHAHGGIDPVAVGRAAWQAVSSGRIVSGGSTLSMQVARLLAPPRPRTFAAKIEQIEGALALEARLSKAEILALYLTLAPYGGNIEGVRAASLAYFAKEPTRLTLGETALLVALPQAPEARRPDRHPAAARRARDRVLDRLAKAGLISADEVRLARAEPVPGARKPMPQLAPHLAEAEVAARPGLARHPLTLDAGLQARLETLARERTAAFGRGLSAAIVVVDNASGEVRAYVGSPDHADAGRAGAVDLARAVRSPGSTLKPFIYALAFEDGLVHPDSLIEDTPARFGAWRPENFDRSFQGTLPVRKALQLSLNVPAVRLLEAVGPDRLAARLRQAGARLELPAGAGPALPMGLGGVGIRLVDLAMLYAALARGGEAQALSVRTDVLSAPRRAPLVGEVAAWYVGQSLLGTPAPENALGGRIAFKTGTSYGYRDSWAVGFDGRRTVAVWVGRPDGAPVPGLAGRTAAAPLLFEAFARITRTPAGLGPAPRGALIASNARLPPPQRHFGRPRGEEDMSVLYPPDGARVAGESAASGEPLALKVSGGAFPLTLLLDGRPVARAEDRRILFWTPEGRGFSRLTVIDATGATASVTVRVE